MSVFENEQYENWRKARLEVIFEVMTKEWFDGKKVLVLGDGEGDIGNKFMSVGANVISLEGRQQNVNIAKIKFPKLEIYQADLNIFSIQNNYDLIVSMGVLYHLYNPIFHLKEIISKSNNIILETDVLDSKYPFVSFCSEPVQEDQALDSIGCKPSQVLIEDCLTLNGFHFKRFDDDRLIVGYLNCAWKNKFDNSFFEGQKRFWIASKTNEFNL